MTNNVPSMKMEGTFCVWKGQDCGEMLLNIIGKTDRFG